MTPACGVGGREAAFELNEVDRRRPAGQRRVDAAVAPGTGGARRVAGSDAKTVVAKSPGTSATTRRAGGASDSQKAQVPLENRRTDGGGRRRTKRQKRPERQRVLHPAAPGDDEQ